MATDSNALLSSLDLAVFLSAVKPDSDITDRDHVVVVDVLCVDVLCVGGRLRGNAKTGLYSLTQFQCAGLSGYAESQRPLMDSNHRPTA